MTRLNCGSCAAFNRDAPVAPEVVGENVTFPAEAQCRRTAPPWAVVKATDWCMAWCRRRDNEPRQDDGA